MKRNNSCDPKRRASFPHDDARFLRVLLLPLLVFVSFASAGKHQRAKHSSSFSRVVDEENFDTFAEINGGNDIGNDGGRAQLDFKRLDVGKREEERSHKVYEKSKRFRARVQPLPPPPRKANARHLNRKHSQSARQITHRKSRNTESTSL